jgi:hypothetical protein
MGYGFGGNAQFLKLLDSNLGQHNTNDTITQGPKGEAKSILCTLPWNHLIPHSCVECEPSHDDRRLLQIVFN